MKRLSLVVLATVAVACSANELVPVPIDAGAPIAPDSAAGAGEPEASTTPGPDGPSVDPERCHLLCLAAEMAACERSPAHVDCLAWCDALIAGCREQAAALLGCQFAAPLLACTASGAVTSLDCKPEFDASEACGGSVSAS